MILQGIHFLLTYQCTYECEHCFVWGSPNQEGTFTLAGIDRILEQAAQLGSITSIYFEGGEAFLFHPILLEGVLRAAGLGFDVGIVSNAYWATSAEDALYWLKPLAGLVSDLSISSDLFHHECPVSPNVEHALTAARRLGIPAQTISIGQPLSGTSGEEAAGADEGSGLMYRGRAAENLAAKAIQPDYRTFTSCPYEDLLEPGRVHVDPLGNVHICQGIVIGNLFEYTLREVCEAYVPSKHPIVGPLIDSGPVGLFNRYQLKPGASYADACHMCYEARLALRARFPLALGPGQMYGV
jgi:MoaA/NifB/PqqE/SkfB family radical SAM enzyme